MVFSVSIQTICDSIFYGPSTNFDCISVCTSLWHFCVDNDFLKKKKMERLNLVSNHLLVGTFDLTHWICSKRKDEEKNSDMYVFIFINRLRKKFNKTQRSIVLS